MKLEVHDLRRAFGSLQAVDGISFALESGQIYGFVGPNGAGKTTTMRILATLDEPDSGDAVIDGVSIVQNPEQTRRAVGFMPDSLPAHQDITVEQYLDFFARAYGLRGAVRRRVLDSVVDFTRMEGIREKHIRALSKGLKQRVSLARSLVHDPNILVLDEPAAGLDPRARVELRELLLALAAEGKAILISSHILSELSEICHGAVIVEHGRIVHSGTIEELLHGTGVAGDAAAASRWVVRLRGLEPREVLHKALLTAPHVIEIRGAGEYHEVELTGGEEAACELLAHLVASGRKIVEFQRQRTGLEDVFLRVTRGDVR